MKYYAVLCGNELVQVGTQPGWLPEHETIELTVDQARSLLSGATAWRDWVVIDGVLVSARQADPGLPRFANLLVPAKASSEGVIFVTEKDNPLALYDTIIGKRHVLQQEVSFWQKKKRTE